MGHFFCVAPHSKYFLIEHQVKSFYWHLFQQVQVGGKKNSVILQKLTHDTPYSITVAAVYRTGEIKDISGQGKTSKWLQENPFNVLKYFMIPSVEQKQW